MTALNRIINILQVTDLPFAYSHFAEGESPQPPFIVFLFPASNNFSADGRVYHPIVQCHIELYTTEKNPTVERVVENALDAAGIFYNKSEVWIESESLYEILYQFEMEEENHAEE